jgi:hypothetical protein
MIGLWACEMDFLYTAINTSVALAEREPLSCSSKEEHKLQVTLRKIFGHKDEGTSQFMILHNGNINIYLQLIYNIYIVFW